MEKPHKTALETIRTPLTLPCGLTLPNRLVKCPMQETLAKPPLFDPPVEEFTKLYDKWASAEYGLIITGQVQIDLRFLSVPGDVATHPQSDQGAHLEKWVAWRKVAKSRGTPVIVQLAHPGRMSAQGAGVRPKDMQTWCASSVPVEMGTSWVDKWVRDQVLGIPKAMTLDDIDEVVGLWKHGATVSRKAGFDGIQLHGAHGFLLSQFLSPHTNRRNDDYGGSPENRMKLLKRLVTEIREENPAPFCLSVKLNSADYMAEGGLQTDEGLAQVRWLRTCGMVDFVEISGGNAEQSSSKLHNSFGSKTMEKAPVKKEGTKIREAFFTDFAERVMAEDGCPVQLSGGFRSRVGMADAIESGECDLIGLGRAAVLEPTLPASVILNDALKDDEAFAKSHQLKGLWLAKYFPVKIVGSGFGIQFFYYNMRRLGRGLPSAPDLSIPQVLLLSAWESWEAGLRSTLGRILQGLDIFKPRSWAGASWKED